MKKKAREMLDLANFVAARFQARLRLPVTTFLDDHLTHSFLVISADPNMTKPGKYHEMRSDAGAMERFTDAGVEEFLVEIPSGKREATLRASRVRIEKRSDGSEWYVTDEVPLPLPPQLQEKREEIAKCLSELGFFVKFKRG